MFPKIFSYFGLIFKSDLILPLILVVVYILLWFIARGVFPSSQELVDSFASLYQKYGVEIIFIAALVESLILVNLLMPGQVAMVLGVIFARSGQTDLVLVILAASIGAICGYIIDYTLGYFGFADILKRLGYGDFLDQARAKIKKFGKRGLILGFIHTSIASVFSLTAGILKLNPLSFIILACVSTFFWASIWGLIVYAMGDIVLIILRKYAFLLVILTIASLFLMRYWKKDNVST